NIQAAMMCFVGNYPFTIFEECHVKALQYDDLPAKQKLMHCTINFIISRDFWIELEPVCKLLKPIDEVLKMFESGKVNLEHVLGNWMEITKYLKQQQVLDAF